MHIVVTGATGSVGTAFLEALGHEPRVRSITAIARHLPERELRKAYYVRADVAEEQLAPLFEGADAVVHLAWQFQPEKRPDELWSTNVLGSRRVFDAVRQAAVPRLVYVSSFAAYGPREKTTTVDESFPRVGIASSLYSRHKAEAERRLDEFEARYEGIDIVRLRPCATLGQSAVTGFVKRFADSFPGSSFDDAAQQIALHIARTPLQVVSARDVAEAARLAVFRDVRGAFNIVPRPTRSPKDDVSATASTVVATAASLAVRLRLSRVDQSLLELAGRAPLLDGSRAERVLGFCSRNTTEEIVAETLSGLRHGAARLPAREDSAAASRLTAQISNSVHVSTQYHPT